MPYIGNTIRAADDYRLIDDISSSFNGSTTSFALQVAGSAPVPFPKSPQQVLISVNGVIQEPDPSGSSGFNLVGTNIVFSSAPTGGHAFFGIIYATADYLNAGGNFPAGSLGAPSITFIGDENTGLYRKGGGSIGFVADATEIANTDSNGLTISSGNLILPDSIIHNGDSDTKIRFPSANQISFETNGSEGVRIDGGGNLLIGTAAARTFGGGVYAHLQLEGTTQQGSQFTVTRNSNDSFAPNISLVKTRGTSDGAVTTVQDNDSLGTIQFRGADGTDVFAVAASITGEVDGSPSDGTDMPGALVFGTTADGAASPTERLRIGAAGQIGIAGTNYGTSGQVLTSGGSGGAISWSTVTGTTINNNADNRIITGSGTANTLNGESSITYDGTKILNISSSAGGFFQGTDTDGGVGLVEMGAGNVALQADTGNAIADSKIHFFVDGSEKMVIQDDGDFYFNNNIGFKGSSNAIRTNIVSTQILAGTNSSITTNRDTAGKITIRAGDADSTSIDDDNTAIKIYPAANRSASAGTKYGGISWNHLDPVVYTSTQYTGSSCWLGASIHDTVGQERDNFEIVMNDQTGNGTHPNKSGFRLSPEGYHSFPNTPVFIGEGSNYTQNTDNSTYSDVIPHFDLTIRGISRSGAELTVPEDGIYHFSITYLFHPNNESQYMTSRIVVNGSQAGDIIQGGGNATGHSHRCFTKLLSLSASDVVKFQFKTATGEVHGGQVNWAFYKVA